MLLLGKALFWDLQTGSDGKQACASCHFHAGADHRLTNQLSDPVNPPHENYTLLGADFPFHQLSNPNDKNSPVVKDSTQVNGSGGIFTRMFNWLLPGLATESGEDSATSTFQLDGLNTRQVTPRNSPSAINAVYNFRNFLDGRARNLFTGQTPFGASDTAPHLLSNTNGALELLPLALEDSSLASQAVGPVVSSVEMSYAGQNWPDVGKKMLTLRPLAYQHIAADDSVLGAKANQQGPGFAGPETYLDLVQNAFRPELWNSAQEVDVHGTALDSASTLSAEDRYSQAQYNFSIFFGLSVQAYEATLVSDDAPVDRAAEGQTSALSAAQIRGQLLFAGTTGCSACHAGPEFTLATRGGIQTSPLAAGEDTGFFHIGVRPATEDVGLGGLDDFGQPLAAQLPTDAADPASAQGRFKTPGLRNVVLTGPYFHNGSQATLSQVLDFYNRGGDFPVNADNGPNIRPLNFTASERSDLLAFFEALTDERVLYERAPFDHPELCVANGHPTQDGHRCNRPEIRRFR